MNTLKQFKIRASAAHQIMTDPQGSTPMEVYLNAVDKVKDLQATQDAAKDKTTKTAVERQRKIDQLNKVDIPLLEKNKNGVLLSLTCITYVQTWIKEQIYNRKKEFTSKYTEKGNHVEKAAIEFASDVYGWGLVEKNEQHYINDYLTGTPDLVLRDLTADTKASWSCFSFPLFETELDKAYYWQNLCYMDLTGRGLAATVYTLMDAPEHIIEAEARTLSFKAGYTEVDADFYEQVKENMTYSNLPDELRIKRFNVERNSAEIDNLKDRVEKCRWYLNSISTPAVQSFLQLKQTA